MIGVRQTSTGTIRHSGSKMRDSADLRSREYPHRKTTVPIFKRTAANASLERSDKCDGAVDYFAASKLEIMRGSREGHPAYRGVVLPRDNLTGATGGSPEAVVRLDS